MNEKVSTLVWLINTSGIIAFAFSGAAAAMKKEADIVGVLILSLIACSCGGLMRDLLLGDTPPELLRSNFILLLAVITGLITYFFHSVLDKMTRPIDVFDALGLGLFAVVGAGKAMSFNLNPTWSIGMGVITAVGGGVVRDMMLAEVPIIFRSQIYATAAFLGAIIYVAGTHLAPGYASFFMVLGAVACSGLRLMAIFFNWHLRH